MLFIKALSPQTVSCISEQNLCLCDTRLNTCEVIDYLFYIGHLEMFHMLHSRQCTETSKLSVPDDCLFGWKGGCGLLYPWVQKVINLKKIQLCHYKNNGGWGAVQNCCRIFCTYCIGLFPAWPLGTRVLSVNSLQVLNSDLSQITRF